MTGITLALMGISGVGKTTLLNEVIGHYPNLERVSAGQLLSKATNTSADALRTVDAKSVGSNQELLAAEFESLRSRKPDVDLILDAHVIIDNDAELVIVPLSVIRRIGPRAIILLEDDPGAILRRRTGDTLRRRPIRTAAQLSEHQRITRELCAKYAFEISIPLETISPRSSDRLKQILNRYLQES